MSRDRLFGLVTLALTIVVPGLLLLGRPFAEPRAAFGVLTGWGLGLLVIVPSYFLLAWALRTDNSQRFLMAFLGGSAGRFVVVIASVGVFALTVDDAPLKSFLLSFFLGYMLLTGLEFALALGASSRASERDHA